MDRITTSLLSEFCSENDLESQPEHRQFEHFACYLAVNRNYTETFDTADVVTGGGNDLGIDGIACIVNGTLVTDPDLIRELADTNGYIDAIFVFVQADRSSSFESAKLGTFAPGNGPPIRILRAAGRPKSKTLRILGCFEKLRSSRSMPTESSASTTKRRTRFPANLSSQ